MRTGLLRVLVVDDHIGVRKGVASLIDAEQPRMCCVGDAGYGVRGDCADA